MLLTYSKERFKPAILAGEKIHTIREDKTNRWRPGMSIQHWLFNPRHKKFRPAHQFLENECRSIQNIMILRSPSMPYGLAVLIDFEIEDKMVKAGRWLQDFEITLLAQNDGLTVDELREWFVPEGSKPFYGRIIHWTDLKY